MSRAKMEPLRTLASGSISASYAAVGTPTANPVRLFCITNATMGDMIFSLDGINDHMFLKAGSFKLFDVQSNIAPSRESAFMLDEGTQFYVKQSTAPTSGDVYVEILYGLN